MEKKVTRDIRYSGTMSKELLDKLKELAKKKDRSFNSLVKIILKEYVDKENAR
jgi:predicted transcriptional regulator